MDVSGLNVRWWQTMHSPLKAFTRAVVTEPGHPTITTVWGHDWPVTPPCMSVTVTSRQPIRDHATGPTKTFFLVDFWNNDADTAEAHSHTVVDNLTNLAGKTSAYGRVVSATLISGPTLSASDQPTQSADGTTTPQVFRASMTVQLVTDDA